MNKEDRCPDCGRVKAHSIDDIMAGHCEKWYAVRDKEARVECLAIKNFVLSQSKKDIIFPNLSSSYMRMNPAPMASVPMGNFLPNMIDAYSAAEMKKYAEDTLTLNHVIPREVLDDALSTTRARLASIMVEINYGIQHGWPQETLDRLDRIARLELFTAIAFPQEALDESAQDNGFTPLQAMPPATPPPGWAMAADREMLEFAAKTLDYELSFGEEGCLYKPANTKYFVGRWNPLTDDGDALRLVVKLQLLVDLDDEGCYVVSEILPLRESYSTDPYAATRRAITRAAAEIGKAMPL